MHICDHWGFMWFTFNAKISNFILVIKRIEWEKGPIKPTLRQRGPWVYKVFLRFIDDLVLFFYKDKYYITQHNYLHFYPLKDMNPQPLSLWINSHTIMLQPIIRMVLSKCHTRFEGTKARWGQRVLDTPQCINFIWIFFSLSQIIQIMTKIWY